MKMRTESIIEKQDIEGDQKDLIIKSLDNKSYAKNNISRYIL